MKQLKKELTLTRELNAPVTKVWDAWIDPEKIAKWWGPDGVTNPTCVWDARVGGEIHIVMLAGPELGSMAGQKWPMRGEFVEVVPNERLVFKNFAVGPQDQHLIEGTTTVTFEDIGGKTKITVHNDMVGLTPIAEQMLAGADMGWNQQLDKLIAFVQ
jgi:uncharacterized protein YndB with AHSA1/START domain